MRLFNFLAATVLVALIPCGITLALEAGEPRLLPDRPNFGVVTQVAYSCDGESLCVGYEQGFVLSWDVKKNDQVGSGRHVNTVVTAMAAYPKAPIMVHASELGIKFHLIGAHGKVPSFDAKHKATVQAIDFNLDGDRMASGDRDGETIVWDLWTGEPKHRLQPGNSAVESVRYFSDGNRLAIATEDGKLRIWDVKEEKVLREIQAHDGPCLSVALSPDHKWIATCGKDKKIKLWGAEDGKAGPVLEGHEDCVNIVIFHPGGLPFLASASDDKTVRLWSLAEKKVVQKLEHDAPVYGMSWRPDGGAIATGSGVETRIYDFK